MTDSTREILGKYQIRKTGKQKNAFIEYMRGVSDGMGYELKVESGALGAKNLVVGDVSRAKVVYSAHYDTAPVLPFPNFITPKNFGIYLLYNAALVLGFVAIALLVGFACDMLALGSTVSLRAVQITYVLLLVMLLAGPANKHTANDNTSGVTLLLDIMRELPADKRADVAFVFFDLEEAGLLGSMAFAKAHKAQMKNKLLVNFDCVSDGSHMLFMLRKGARGKKIAFESAFASADGIEVEVVEKGTFYPSDQANFSGGVGVAALNSTKSGLLYMGRIHTHRDIVYDEKNIEFLKNGALKLIELL